MIITNVHPSLPKSADVIVIGSGFAGLSAAIEASLKGANVIVLEKMRAIGGNSVISDGGIAAPCSSEQLAEGIEDSAERMFADMMRSGEGLNDPEIVKIVCDQALEAYQWTKDFLHVSYLPRVNIFGGHQVPRCYTPSSISGHSLIMKMKEKLDELSVPIFLGTSVESFLMDDKQTIIGVKVNPDFKFNQESTEITQEIMALKGVIIATGGYSADVAFRQKFDSKLDKNIQTTNKLSATSELLQKCIDLNAKTVHLDQIQCVPWTTPDESGYAKGALFGDYIVSSYGILIDPATGKRFVNESGNRKVVSDAIFGIGNWVVGIADTASVQHAGWDLSLPLKKGIIKTFATIEELAQGYAIPVEAIRQTIKQYNGDIKKGDDSQFQKQIETWMKPLKIEPFYAMRIFPKTHYTLGGLVINGDANVVKTDGSIFNGLFAAGEITGCTHGANRLGSCSLTECIVMGRIAGQSVLNQRSIIEAITYSGERIQR